MIKKDNLSGKRILIFTAAIVIVAVAVLSYANIESNLVQIPKSNGSIGGVVGIPDEDYYNYSSPVTLEQAASALNFSIVMPTFLPLGVTLAQSRYTSSPSDLYLVYSVNGSLLIKDSSKGGLLISEQSANTNPLPSLVIVNPPVVETQVTSSGSATRVVTTFTLAQASTIVTGWNNVTIAGQSALVGAYKGEAQVQWWHDDVWYHLWGMLPLQTIEKIAQSMMTSQDTAIP